MRDARGRVSRRYARGICPLSSLPGTRAATGWLPYLFVHLRAGRSYPPLSLRILLIPFIAGKIISPIGEVDSAVSQGYLARANPAPPARAVAQDPLRRGVKDFWSSASPSARRSRQVDHDWDAAAATRLARWAVRCLCGAGRAGSQYAEPDHITGGRAVHKKGARVLGTAGGILGRETIGSVSLMVESFADPVRVSNVASTIDLWAELPSLLTKPCCAEILDWNQNRMAIVTRADRNERETDELGRTFGETVRRLRIKAGLTLEKLAASSDVSRAMLSSVERGEKSPTLSVLAGIASGLNVTLSELMSNGSESTRVAIIRKRQRMKFRDSKTGIERHLLSPTHLDKGIELVEHVLPKGQIFEALPSHDPKTDKYLVVVQGRLTVELEDVVYSLAEEELDVLRSPGPLPFRESRQ